MHLNPRLQKALLNQLSQALPSRFSGIDLSVVGALITFVLFLQNKEKKVDFLSKRVGSQC
jgi:hypothetical protein